MIIEKTEQNTSLFETTELGLVQDDLVFSMMMDGIYTDKVSSVIREISTNAHDSMIAAGNTEGFEIILEVVDDLKTLITIKDEGLGLSKEEAENYLCKLNASSKRDSNEFIGCFGIGSKSVLSVTPKYTYTCNKDGKEAFLTIGREGKRAPTFEIVDYDSDKPNGVECTFLLSGYTLDFVLSTIYSELLLFKIKPTISVVTNSSNKEKNSLEDEQEETIEVLEDFFPEVIDKGLYYAIDVSNNSQHNISFIQNKHIACGIISYPMPTKTSRFTSKYSTGSQNKLIKDTSLRSFYIVPKLEVGSVDINVSRETLASTPKTDTAIEELYNALSKEEPFRTYIEVKKIAITDYVDFAPYLPLLRSKLEILSKEDLEVLAALFFDCNFRAFTSTAMGQIASSEVGETAIHGYRYPPSGLIIAWLLKHKELTEDFHNLDFGLVFNSIPHSFNFETLARTRKLSKPLVYKTNNRFTNSLSYMEDLENDVIVIRSNPRRLDSWSSNIALIKSFEVFDVYELEEIKDLYPESYKALKTSQRRRTPSESTQRRTPSTGPTLTVEGFKSGVKHEKVRYYKIGSEEVTQLDNQFTSNQLKNHLRTSTILFLPEEYLPVGSPKLSLDPTITPEPWHLSRVNIVPLAEQSDPEEIMKIYNNVRSSNPNWIYLAAPSLDLITKDLILGHEVQSLVSSLYNLESLEKRLENIEYVTKTILFKLLKDRGVSGWLSNSILRDFLSHYTESLPALKNLYDEIYNLLQAFIKSYTKLLDPDFAECKQSFINEHF